MNKDLRSLNSLEDIEFAVKRYQKLLRYEAEEQHLNKIYAERFRVKSQCSICGYQSLDIYPEQNSLCPTSWCEGSMEEFNNESNK